MSNLSKALEAAGLGPLVYSQFRVPAPAPAPVNDNKTPGLIAWGTVGSLPSGVLVEGDGFETIDCDEKHVETTRVSHDVRIENPDNNKNWVEVARADSMNFNKTETTKKPGNNTSTASADFGGFEATPIEWSSFKPLGTENTKKCKLVVTLANKQRDA